jgi:hypothetical protein
MGEVSPSSDGGASARQEMPERFNDGAGTRAGDPAGLLESGHDHDDRAAWIDGLIQHFCEVAARGQSVKAGSAAHEIAPDMKIQAKACK